MLDKQQLITPYHFMKETMVLIFYTSSARKKLEESLQVEEDRLRNALAKGVGSSSPSLGATIYASQFAANALRALVGLDECVCLFFLQKKSTAA